MSAGNVFETLRDRVPIADVVRQYSEVKGSKARCVSPDHLDENPSMHVYDVHVHCFGCGFRGDVTDVWAVQREIERPIEAALDLAREFNIRLPEMNTEAKREAQKRREKQDDSLQLARSCHAALEKHPRVREWWEKRGFGPDLQQRFLLGTNKGGTEAVIPSGIVAASRV
jgi:DNA primase